MVSPGQRVRKLEKKVAYRSPTGDSDDRVSRSSGDTGCQHPLWIEIL